MALWKLEPVNPSEHHWRASTYIGPVIARAPDELEARSLAVDSFCVAAQVLPGMDTPLLPWAYKWLVTCERFAESGFEEDGPDTILGPEEALAKVHPS